MDRPLLPLNALRTFEVAARQGSFTAAAGELRVTQAAVSHQILRLEDQLGVKLFHRTSKGLVPTSEAEALLPLLSDSFDRIGGLLDQVRTGRYVETVNLGVVTTFASGWLVPRLAAFERDHPGLRLRLFTNSNKVDLTREGLDAAIRFGDGGWQGETAVPLMESPLTPLCAPGTAARLASPADLHREVLLRSYRVEEWPAWFEAAGADGAPDPGPPDTEHGTAAPGDQERRETGSRGEESLQAKTIDVEGTGSADEKGALEQEAGNRVTEGTGSASPAAAACGAFGNGHLEQASLTFDSSIAMAELAASGYGVALLPWRMFEAQLESGRLARPFRTELSKGRYWLTRPSLKPATPGVHALEVWLKAEAG
ncbi:LysR family transcriptional regulator [Roseibium suaedae]|uniref:DNA-binding transcriptional regulator, LysR family n=1 Tax=Roseibium suaedae TaxID=735517 RepID=A0A1M7P8T2_9HYPH|nr:LysR family transcriptional regulator [Roseibium suaedae]SHN13063.1 DNA-binding transcriptional regulator, LysR family [Roseibium suaedae]